MTVARSLAKFLTQVSYADLPPQTVEHAAMLIATSLAMAERTGASGQDVLAAIVLGYEASGRIGEAVTPGLHNRGFHGCLIAIFAGAVATGRLLGLDAVRMAREYHAGLAAMLGVQAALAVHKGYVAEEGILETRQGFFEVYEGATVTIRTKDGRTF